MVWSSYDRRKQGAVKGRKLLILGGFFVLLVLAPAAGWSQVGTGVFRVDISTGVDSAGCGSVSTPCKNIQQAINLAGSGDEIRVATGTYTYQASLDTLCTGQIGTSVLCLKSDALTILGGYSSGNWSSADPASNPTIIDGGGTRRGVLAENSNLSMIGFTIQNGYRKGASSGGDQQTFAFGGGMLADISSVSLTDMVFKNNLATGGDTASEYGGAGAGGGLALRQVEQGSTLTNVTFEDNEATGGTGPVRGGIGVGGGLFVVETNVTASNLKVNGNIATGGSSSGSGETANDLLRGDALGGGIAVQVGSTVTLGGSTVDNNQAVGGSATTKAGRAFGGGIYVEGQTSRDSLLTVNDSTISSNVAVGADAVNGGLAAGGGLMAQNGSVTLDRSKVLGNRSSGGDGNGGLRGDAGGGGAYFSYWSALGGSRQLVVRNSVLAGNLTEIGETGTIVGGGGGALFLQGFVGTIDHMTCDGNEVGQSLQGGCMVLLNSDVSCSATVRYSAISGHTANASQDAVHLISGASLTFSQGAFSGNNSDYGGGGTISGTGSMSSFPSGLDFTSPGFPDYDYHLASDSPLLDLAVSSTEIRDMDYQTRSGLRDVGADEYSIIPKIFSDDFDLGTTNAWSLTIP
jgi:hypothetical protein